MRETILSYDLVVMLSTVHNEEIDDIHITETEYVSSMRVLLPEIKITLMM